MYSGEFSAADSNIECAPGDDSEVSTLILTNLDSVTPPYEFPFNGRGVDIPGGVIEEGTYQVTLENNLGVSVIMPSTIDLVPGQSNRLTIIYYFEADALVDPPDSDDLGAVNVDCFRCDDPERAGQTEFLQSTEINGAAEADNCTLAGIGEAGLVLSGTPLGDGTFDPQTIVSSPGGEFTFESFCFGTYTLTDLATGDVSEPFPVGGSAGPNSIFWIYTFQCANSNILPVVVAETIFCQDDDRAGHTDFFISYGEDDIILRNSNTCFHDVDGIEEQTWLTLKTSPGGDFVMERQVWAYEFWNDFPTQFSPVPAGTYTLNAEFEGTDDYESVIATSDPFPIANGDRVHIHFINFVGEKEFQPPVPSENELDLIGQLFYCTSEGREGEVDFIIDNRNTSDEALAAAADSTCRPAEPDEGLVYLYAYGDGAGIPEEPLSVHYPYHYYDGAYFFNDYLLPGYCQFGFTDSSFSGEEYLSDTFTLSEALTNAQVPANVSRIRAYRDVPASTNIYLEEHICSDPDLADITGFFVNVMREGTFDDYLDAADSTNCRFISEGEAEEGGSTFTFTFTLTNT